MQSTFYLMPAFRTINVGLLCFVHIKVLIIKFAFREMAMAMTAILRYIQSTNKISGKYVERNPCSGSELNGMWCGWVWVCSSAKSNFHLTRNATNKFISRLFMPPKHGVYMITTGFFGYDKKRNGSNEMRNIKIKLCKLCAEFHSY